MRDVDELEPALRRFLDEMRAEWRKYPPLATLSFPEQRAVAEKVRSRWAVGGAVMRRTIDRTFDPGAGDLRVRVHLPQGVAGPAPALVYLHGGGFTLFSIDTHDRLMREYAARGGFAVVGVDYPLSPEAKYPAALDRIEGLLLWLAEHGTEMGLDGTRLAVGGDSAGANLAFAATLRLRDRGQAGLIRAILSNYGAFSPEVSDAAEAHFGGEGSIMDRAEVEQYFANYFGDPSQADDPFACPLAADLSGSPPVLLVIPERDVIAEQSYTMEARLRRAGVETDSRIYRGAIHSFLEAMSTSQTANEAIDDGAAFIRGKIV